MAPYEEILSFVQHLAPTWRSPQPASRPLLPILLDTTYFQPFAALIASVPCGARALPVAFTTYHRRTLHACFPPAATWPGFAVAARPPAAAEDKPFRSQNQIEMRL